MIKKGDTFTYIVNGNKIVYEVRDCFGSSVWPKGEQTKFSLWKNGEQLGLFTPQELEKKLKKPDRNDPA